MNRRYLTPLLLLILTVGVFGCEGGCPLIKREHPVQPSAPTVEKFEILSRWIPVGSNAIVTADIYQLSQSRFWKQIAESRPFRFFDLIKRQGISLATDIGMLVVFAKIESVTVFNGPVLLLQGGFHQDLILSRIKSEALKEGLGLKQEVYKDKTIYFEEDSSAKSLASQALSAVDDGVIAFGSVQNLKWMIDNKNRKGEKENLPLVPSDWNYPIRGMIVTEGALKSSLPPPWNAIDKIELRATIADDLAMSFSIALGNPSSADALAGSLEGFKALEIIEYLDEPDTLSIIEHVNIRIADGSVLVDLPENVKVLHTIFERKKENPDDQGEMKNEIDDLSKPQPNTSPRPNE